MTVADTIYFLSNPHFGNADDQKYQNSCHFLGKDRFGKENNYTHQEVVNAINKAARRAEKINSKNKRYEISKNPK